MNIYLLFLTLFAVISTRHTYIWRPYQWVTQSEQVEKLTNDAITLRHPQSKNSNINIKGLGRPTLIRDNYSRIEYGIGEGDTLTIISNKKNLFLNFNCMKNKERNIVIDVKLTPQLSQSFKKQSSLKLFPKKSKNQCRVDHHQNGTITLQCKVNQCSTFNLQTDSAEDNWYQVTLINGTQEHRNYIKQFMKTFNISEEITDKSNSTYHGYDIVEYAISSCINSLCIYEDQFSEKYLGFCYNGKFQFKLSPYTIQMLYYYDPKFAEFVYYNYLSALEAKTYYPTPRQSASVNQYPEYLQIFQRFINPTDPLRQANLLTAIFAKLNLQRLSSLHQQVNYREQKKLHPYLAQMLTQPYQFSNKFKSFKSIYDESPTSDYKYHSYGETLYQSHTKISWLLKMLNQLTTLKGMYFKNFLSQENLKEQLQQEFTMMNLMQKLLLQQDNVKKGEYLDIVQIPNSGKFYAKNYGYGNLLSFLYIGQVFPTNAFMKLSSQYGLKSSSQQYPPSTYRFRGDIHAYFNARVFSELKKKLSADRFLSTKQKTEIEETAKKMQESIKMQLLSQYAANQEIPTCWNDKGESKQSIPWLRIISILFLREKI